MSGKFSASLDEEEKLYMKSKISNQPQVSQNMTDSARVAAIALTVTILMIGIAYLLSAFKQTLFG